MLARLVRAKHKAERACAALDEASRSLLDGDKDEAIYDLCKKAEHELDMAFSLVRRLRYGS